MASKAIVEPPFDVYILQSSSGRAPDHSTTLAHLPATYRTRHDCIAVPELGDLEFLEQQLLVTRLNAVQPCLRLAGRPMPPRPLHYQIVLQRDIVITEQPDLHMVWANGRFFVKPLPAYLLDQSFWLKHLLPDEDAPESHSMRRQHLAGCARGLLFSYTALVQSEADFRIAYSNGLLPSEVTWAGWKQLAAQLVASHSYASMNPRYWYGELRLGRLNKIYRWRLGALVRGYSRVAAAVTYEDLFRDNFAWLAAVFTFVIVILTAMQVGLATKDLASNQAFSDASYGFSVFSIILLVFGSAAILVVALIIFVSNWSATKRYEKRRFREMGVEPPIYK